MNLATLDQHETISSLPVAELIRDLLTPPSTVATKDLVEQSGLARIHEWAEIARLGAFYRGPEFQNSALETFAQLQSEAPEVTGRRLSSPIFRGWLNWTGYAFCHLENSAPLVDSQLRLWNNMRFSLAEPGNFEAVLAVVDGICFSWDPRLTVEVGDRTEVFVRRDGTKLTVRDLAGAMLWKGHVDPHGCGVEEAALGCNIQPAPNLPDTGVVVRSDIPALRLRLSGTCERESEIMVGELGQRELYANTSPTLCMEAADLLRLAWVDEYRDFHETLQVVVPCAVAGVGMTVSSHQGAVWIMATNLLGVYESLVHEQSHVKLRYIEECYPILEPKQNEERFRVAWRPDPRPLIGIYEGIYVSIHSAWAISRALGAGLVPVRERGSWRFRLEQLIKNVGEALPVLEHNATFTAAGRVFIPWVAQSLESVPA